VFTTPTKQIPRRELEFPDPLENFAFDRQVVVFWGQDGEVRVRCEISQQALNDHFKADRQDELAVFRANRKVIEDFARQNYLANQTEPDGSILIRTLERTNKSLH
jgi:Protein of unknown function (DUF1488)